MSAASLTPGLIFEGVMLETCKDVDVTRPRVRCVSHFPSNIRVEFPRRLREDYPIGTRFKATVKVCQKHWEHDGTLKGAPYLRATEIGIIVSSIPDPGMRAKIVPGTSSGRAYFYIWDSI